MTDVIPKSTVTAAGLIIRSVRSTACGEHILLIVLVLARPSLLSPVMMSFQKSRIEKMLIVVSTTRSQYSHLSST